MQQFSLALKKTGWYGGFWELGHNSHGWRKSTQAKCRLRIRFDATWRPKKLFCASLCDARWNWLTNRTQMKRGSKYLGIGRCFLKHARDEPILRKYIDSSFLLIQHTYKYSNTLLELATSVIPYHHTIRGSTISRVLGLFEAHPVLEWLRCWFTKLRRFCWRLQLLAQVPQRNWSCTVCKLLVMCCSDPSTGC